MKSTFIRFLKDKNHLISDIERGFILREHDIQFKPSVYSILPSIIEFWKNNGIKYPIISEIIEQYENLNENEFWTWMAAKMNTDQMFNYRVSYIFAQINTAKIKMKCFTELRDNQKLHPHHKYFGEYGISMSEKWMIKNNADRIIYVSSGSEITNRIGRLLTILLSTFDGKDTIKSMFDILAFTEIKEHSHEYEWRIVGNHNFAGKSYGHYPDVISFTIDDIDEIYVKNYEDIEQFINVLNDKKAKDNSKSIPKVSKSDSIFLTEKEIEQINRIKSR